MCRSRFHALLMILIAACVICCDGPDSQHPSHEEIPAHMVYIPGSKSSIQSAGAPVAIPAFYMDQTEVTNKQFMEFIEATGYVTTAEKGIDWDSIKGQLPLGTPRLADSLLAPGALVFSPTSGAVELNDPAQWWKWTAGAFWRKPQGPQHPGIDDNMDHPVTQLSWDDASAYCRWRKKSLPTDAQWQWAARGGHDALYPWGNASPSEDKPQANYYQGLFPYQDDATDGYSGTAPVASYEPNGYGLYDMAGNVWEWCTDGYDPYTGKLLTEEQSDPYTQRVMRGGSYLCTDQYCSGYRNDRRMGSSRDTGLDHTGCRCVQAIK